MKARKLVLHHTPDATTPYHLQDGHTYYCQVPGQYGLWLPTQEIPTKSVATPFEGRVIPCANDMPGVWCTDAMVAIRYYEDRPRQQEIDADRRARVQALHQHLFGPQSD